ncbi:kinetochore-associated Ndc80 complex subunit ndc80 [Coemansia thaxteri]|uniref:Kinetochore protein NDC80 n=1 Tax=Coemansia thaxteri TaxID=2663907 RepID=A0A9W8BHS2_9FUNG|nr:kinetochore-associated Ndc80 complex subunit ndc80 [Coemansia thaxteri]KAJ2008729.1 kinetochore-associated Ndc80 complex subunit ndc80 [Coemansia thaxteri]KAJ2472753.1 kinetochore-associated Ndc80 complex subunit ndc80 [Coemansia sp. RSA 2322]
MNLGDGSGIPQPSMIRAPRASMAPSMFAQVAPGSVLQPVHKAEFLGAQTPARGPRGLFGGNGLPQSNVRNNATARLAMQTPGTNRVNRRVSVFASTRRTTLGVPGTATRGGGTKDPRPLKERGYQAKAQQRIMNYLSTHGYPGMLSPKTLSMPTLKDFQTIFRFLYAQLDARYVYQGKFEDNVLSILRGIHYPYVGNISKSHIYSAGSMTTWPGLLAMLLWLVELIECVNLMNPSSDSSELRDSAQFVDRVFFDYLAMAYPVWLDSGEEPAELESVLAQQFEQKNAALIQESADVERRLANVKSELSALQSNESPLVQLERERVELISDKEKFESYIQRLESKHQRMADHVGNQRQQQDAAQVEQMGLERERAEVQAIVDAQQINTEDVDRMNSERNQLVETLQGIQDRVRDAVKVVWDREMKLQRVLDDVESLAQDYASRTHKLGLVGSRKNEHIEVDIELAIDTRTDDRQKITSVDLRRDVRPALTRALDAFASELHATQSAVLEARESMDQLTESRIELEERVDEMDKAVRRHNQRYLELREIIVAEARAATAQIEQLEADIAAMRRDIAQGELQSKAALAHADAEWESVQRGCRLRRAEINEDVVSILEDVVHMKTHAEARLHSLLQLATSDASS